MLQSQRDLKNYFQPKKIFFDHPNHVEDTTGILADAVAEGEEKDRKRSKYKHKAERKKGHEELKKEFKEAVVNANLGENPTVHEVVSYIGCSERTVYTRAKMCGYEVRNKVVYYKNEVK